MDMYTCHPWDQHVSQPSASRFPSGSLVEPTPLATRKTRTAVISVLGGAIGGSSSAIITPVPINGQSVSIQWCKRRHQNLNLARSRSRWRCGGRSRLGFPREQKLTDCCYQWFCKMYGYRVTHATTNLGSWNCQIGNLLSTETCVD